MYTSDGLIYSLPDLILDRFSSHILPKIYQKIEWLHLESRSMERILLATNYPNLYRISLHNIQAKTAIDLFTNETSVIRTLKNQVLSFTIDITTQGTQYFPGVGNAIIFNHIFTMFTNLQYLNFGRSSMYDERLFFCFTRPTVISTKLLELHVCLNTFYDCLYLLDGHFNQLRTLHVDVNIQKTFRDFNDKQIIYWADYFPKEKKGYCRIYSYPYKWKYYDEITNNFPGGIFKYVRKVSLFDERPFEHEFFLRIARSFPFMEKLTVCNQKRQINKRFRESTNINQHLSIIKYPYLKQLYLIDVCIDYYEQFLFDTKTCLPFDVRVYMQYGLVKQVTRNFTRNRTRSNCAKINYLNLCKEMEFPEYADDFSAGKQQLPQHIKDYFPHTQID
ncbi:unnamed protein product [Rotaria sp. Silwood2]|nr:unnamed protein product [Rotaria sp. Silwood2]